VVEDVANLSRVLVVDLEPAGRLVVVAPDLRDDLEGSIKRMVAALVKTLEPADRVTLWMDRSVFRPVDAVDFLETLWDEPAAMPLLRALSWSAAEISATPAPGGELVTPAIGGPVGLGVVDAWRFAFHRPTSWDVQAAVVDRLRGSDATVRQTGIVDDVRALRVARASAAGIDHNNDVVVVIDPLDAAGRRLATNAKVAPVVRRRNGLVVAGFPASRRDVALGLLEVNQAVAVAVARGISGGVGVVFVAGGGVVAGPALPATRRKRRKNNSGRKTSIAAPK